MSARNRSRLIAALLVAPIVVVGPTLWPDKSEPQFIARHFDVLLIFCFVPYAAASWLWLTGKRKRH